jgi:hypothetical protein
MQLIKLFNTGLKTGGRENSNEPLTIERGFTLNRNSNSINIVAKCKKSSPGEEMAFH